MPTHVLAESRDDCKPYARVQRDRFRLSLACLENEASYAQADCNVFQSRDDRAPDSLPSHRRHDVHALDLGLSGVQPSNCAATSNDAV